MKKKFFISFLLSFLCFSLIFLGFGDQIFKEKKPTIAVDENGNISEDENIIEQKIKNEILFLMMGVDVEDLTKTKGMRTDTLMLFKVNLDDGKVNIFSIPRDTRVSVRGKEDKINHAHAFGGVDLTMQTMRDFLGIDIDYYVKVDYRAVKEIVSAIGGVYIDVPQNMKYSDPAAKPPLKINISKGPQLLDGQLAHDFLRFRSYKDGDIGRVKAQQMFMKELIKQTLQIKNIPRIPKLINTYFDYVETNLPKTLILKAAASANKMDLDNIEAKTVPGEGLYIKGVSYYIYDGEETDAIVEEMFGDYLLHK